MTTTYSPLCFWVVIFILISTPDSYGGTSGDWVKLENTKANDGTLVGVKKFKNETTEIAKAEVDIEINNNKFITEKFGSLKTKYNKFSNLWPTNPFVKYYEPSDLANNEDFLKKRETEFKNKPFIIMENLLQNPANSYSFKSISLESPETLKELESHLTKHFKNKSKQDQDAMLKAFYKKLYQICLLSLLTGITIEDSDIFINTPNNDFENTSEYLDKISIKIADLGEGVNILKPETEGLLKKAHEDSCNSSRLAHGYTFAGLPSVDNFMGLETTEDVINYMKAQENDEFYKNKVGPILNLMKFLMSKFSPDSDSSTRDMHGILEKELSKFQPSIQDPIKGLIAKYKETNPQKTELELNPEYQNCEKKILSLGITDPKEIQLNCRRAVDAAASKYLDKQKKRLKELNYENCKKRAVSLGITDPKEIQLNCLQR